MKKLIALTLMLGLTVMVAGPALTTASDTITTTLQKGTGGGTAPIVKVKWEANRDRWSDDDSDEGAQFRAPGEWGAIREYAVCAVVTDPNGVSDIHGVYADIYYPDIPAMEEGDDPDNPTGGCGKFIEENTLTKLSKPEGIELFCNNIQQDNPNLPIFAEGYDFGEVCWELEDEEAYVWCSEKELIYEDPAGEYRVEVFALDKAGNRSEVLENTFEYLPYTGFETDFNSVDYGEVLLDTHKIISGDREWDTSSRPTVRNVGNTRLRMKVAQDDMGLGQSSGNWNVKYDARVGNDESDWRNYWPFKFKDDPGEPSGYDYKKLYEILDLSEQEKMDFSVLVTKWNNDGPFEGEMWLAADYYPFESCD